MSKDSLVKGTLILTAAAFIARILGVVQRVPLIYLIGDVGMATFGIAFNMYTLLLVIATAGIPSALSKLISERMELGRRQEADRIYGAAVQFALGAGLVMALLLFAAAPYIGQYSGNPEATLSVQALAPALLLFPLIAIMRGYFQGRQWMMPNGLSQIIEQIARLLTAIGLAYLFLKIDWGHTWAVAGASFGGVAGSVGAFAVLLYYYSVLRRRDRRERAQEKARTDAEEKPLPRRTIYAMLFRLSIPIVLFSIAVPFIYWVDSMTTIPLLRERFGFEEAIVQLGQLTGRAQSLAGIPIILAIAISQSVVPIVSAAYAKRDLAGVSLQAGKALQLSVLTGLPVVLVIAVAAQPINALIFGSEEGSGIIAFLTVTALFQIVMQTSGAILMGMGIMRPLIVHVGIGLAVKLAASLMLSPYIGIYGIVGSTALCFLTMAWLNLRTLRSQTAFTILGRRRWAGLTITTAAAIGIGLAVLALSRFLLGGLPFLLKAFLAASATAVCVLLVYVALLGLTRVVTKADLETYPASIRKLAGRMARLIKR